MLAGQGMAGTSVRRGGQAEVIAGVMIAEVVLAVAHPGVAMIAGAVESIFCGGTSSPTPPAMLRIACG
ncbi:MAG: hypothetical protein FWC40_09075, partial [Proteobacteria bacterium]|nr:hypothetical protein [Pseudomonadota bacterium]